MAKTDFTRRALAVIRAVPRGWVATYGQIADLAGNPRAARQVVRLLHSSSETEGLPWHRVVNGRGTISLPPGRGYEEQRAMLAAEGVVFDDRDRIDLKLFGWTLV